MLCHFAHQFPPFVANFLESSRDLGRRFREETITDMMMAALQLIGGASVIVRFPNEPKTGADMEWNFVNPYDGTFYRLIIQAKCAYGYGSDWSPYPATAGYATVAGSRRTRLAPPVRAPAFS